MKAVSHLDQLRGDANCVGILPDASLNEIIDAEILADVYLLMTGGQTALSLGGDSDGNSPELNAAGDIASQSISRSLGPFKVLRASDEEVAAHNRKLQKIREHAGQCVWLDGD